MHIKVGDTLDWTAMMQIGENYPGRRGKDAGIDQNRVPGAWK
jgi:hypothetical protein